LQDELQKD